MARYSNFIMGGIASCSINGRQISVIDGEVYVDGVHYVPAEGEDTNANKAFAPGKMVEHKFEVSNEYDTIISKGFFDVIFKQVSKDEDCGVTGNLPENLIKKMDVRVDNGTLIISMKPGSYNLNLPITPTIYVCNKVIKDVTSSGSGDFTIEGILDTKGENFTARTSGSSDFKAGKIKATKGSINISSAGSGDIDLDRAECQIFMVGISGSADVDCGNVSAQISSISIKGSGDVSISGKTDSVEFSIAGSGDIRAGEFKAKSGRASVAGSGDITCNVERLSDRVRGSGDIHNRY